MPELAFDLSEYEYRLEKTRSTMIEMNIDVLVISDPANMYYLTGYNAWSFYVHQVVIIELQGEPAWIGRDSDANGVHLTTYLNSDSIIGYPETCIESIEHHSFKFIGQYLIDKGYDSKQIGVEKEAYYFTARCLEMIQSTLAKANFIDATGLVNKIRLVKSDAEIAYIRQAGVIADKTMQTAIDNIEPGLRQNDAIANIYHTQISGTDEYGGDYSAIVPMLPTGRYSSAPHITWSDQRFKPGEGTIVEIAGCRLRYHCPLARTVYLGKPPQSMIDTEKAVIEGIDNALDAARSGALAQDIELAWRNSVSKWRVLKDSRLGYSLRINYPPDWGEHSTSLRPGDKTVLKENMTFHLMPGLWYDNWGIEISQTFRVRNGGGEPLTQFPRQLIIKN